MSIKEPEWDRYVMHGQATLPPVGDPTRWGAAQVFFWAAGSPNQVSEQVLRAQTSDRYSRSWSLIGTLMLPQATWNAAAVGAFPAAFDNLVALVCDQGVGQTVVRQEILLAVNGITNGPAGLCNTQNGAVSPGAPYLSSFPDGVNEARSFAAIGALIGHTINISPRWNAGIGTGLPTNAILSLILTPYAAGQGL